MSVQEIADDLVGLWRAGKFAEAGERYWADDVVSFEAMGGEREARGKAAVRAKGDGWNGQHEVHEVSVEGPFVNGDTFAVRFLMKFTERASGKPANMDEMALYRIEGGKIAEERFFYGD
jgi:ketosteroid isomerase-like protein